jgi:transcription antitermination protein NusB
MGNRGRGRELAFQILFQFDMGVENLEFIFKHFPDLLQAREVVSNFAKELSRDTLEKLQEIDSKIEALSTNWHLKRLTSVDRALLRLGAYELIWREDIPVEVTINECVELAKKFASEDSPAFVNGVLDQIKKQYACEKKEILKKKKVFRKIKK